MLIFIHNLKHSARKRMVSVSYILHSFVMIYLVSIHLLSLTHRVARWHFLKYRTLAVPVFAAPNIELFTRALSGVTVIFIPDKKVKIPDNPVKYRTLGNPTYSLQQCAIIAGEGQR